MHPKAGTACLLSVIAALSHPISDLLVLGRRVGEVVDAPGDRVLPSPHNTLHDDVVGNVQQQH
eukprot:CAMPEP_0114303642 /NCGR_PEP_ID=MMETSP0059-20121206/15334_1 /TAXON_ID=36894 /ORGANISM="Pyramimonas parkeae, Strain CCMP726" /LENGTH=62 /DNA_ID=CAMNT_0001426631 /DNA_START=297 /DNA_END=485 /DNA_ORIENTATION=-